MIVSRPIYSCKWGCFHITCKLWYWLRLDAYTWFLNRSLSFPLRTPCERSKNNSLYEVFVFEVQNSARSKLLSQVCSLYAHGSTVVTERLLSLVCRGAIKLVGVGGSELSERDSFNTASTIAVEPTRWKVRQGDNQVRWCEWAVVADRPSSASASAVRQVVWEGSVQNNASTAVAQLTRQSQLMAFN